MGISTSEMAKECLADAAGRNMIETGKTEIDRSNPFPEEEPVA
jgi:hypothetical protein